MRFPLLLQKIILEEGQAELFVPEENAVRKSYEKGELEFPYWSQVWPAATALAQFLIHHPEYFSSKTVLEIGAGLGLPSLIAAQNASFVTCTDYAPDAVAVANRSAQYHGMQNFQALVLDWNHLPDNLDADVLLLSDVNYEPAALETLKKLIHRFTSRKATVILSTPQRLMAKDFVLSLLKLCVAQEQLTVLHAGQPVLVSVMVLKE